jgi:hypothetical protein
MVGGHTPFRCRYATRNIVGRSVPWVKTHYYGSSPRCDGVYDFVRLNNGSGNPAVVME